jgi:DnaJ family protein B protein 4
MGGGGGGPSMGGGGGPRMRRAGGGMGGMGGMGGGMGGFDMGGMGGMGGGMPGGFGGQPERSEPPPPPQEVTKPLALTLEELYKGGTKRLKITFIVETKPHPRFERDGDDLIVKLNITLSQALLGPDGGGSITKEIEQLDGRRINVSLPSGQIVQPGQETRVTGEGMPITKANSIKKKGDMIVRWNVVFPKSLTPPQKDALRKVLG